MMQIKKLITFFAFVAFIFVAGVADVHCYIVWRRKGPLKVETEAQVVKVCWKFPKYKASIFMCGHSDLKQKNLFFFGFNLSKFWAFNSESTDCDCLATSHFDYGVVFLANTFFKFFNIFPGQHRSSWNRRHFIYMTWIESNKCQNPICGMTNNLLSFSSSSSSSCGPLPASLRVKFSVSHWFSSFNNAKFWFILLCSSSGSSSRFIWDILTVALAGDEMLGVGGCAVSDEDGDWLGVLMLSRLVLDRSVTASKLRTDCSSFGGESCFCFWAR